MIEVEKRVLLQKSDEAFQVFLDTLIPVSSVKRLSLVNVDNAAFKSNPNRAMDIKFRTNGKVATLVLKTGNWHTDASRPEHEITIQPEEIGSMLHILISLGFPYYVMTYVTRREYRFEKFVFTLDFYHSMDAELFEVEILVANEQEAPQAEKDIDIFLNKHNLRVLDSEATIAFIEKMNAIHAMQVDFTKVSVQDWLKQNSKLISCTV